VGVTGFRGLCLWAFEVCGRFMGVRVTGFRGLWTLKEVCGRFMGVRDSIRFKRFGR